MSSPNDTAQTFSQRYDEKFIVPLETIRPLVLDETSQFSQMFQFDYIISDSYFNIVDNVYFDSPDLSSYHEHLENKVERVKLRLRQYNPDGLPEGITFFEVKEKREGKTFKSRILIRPDWLRPFLASGKFPESELIQMNTDLKREKLSETVQTIYRLVNDEKYLPILRCTYQRYAFRLRESKKVRLTLDRDIRFIRLYYAIYPKQPYEVAVGTNDVIIEAKISDPTFNHLIPMLESNFGQSRGVSKYCLGIFQTRDRFLNETKDVTLRSLDRYRTIR